MPLDQYEDPDDGDPDCCGGEAIALPTPLIRQ